MSKILFFFLFVICIGMGGAYAQKRLTRIVLKDSSTVEGYAKFIDGGKQISVVKEKGDKAEIYSFPDIQKIVMYRNGTFVTYEYIKVINQGTYKLAELLISGKVNLYKFSYKSEGWLLPGPGFPLSGMLGSPISGMPGLSVSVGVGIPYIKNHKDLCVRRPGEKMARYFKDPSTGGSFKQIGAYYFQDCPELSQRIKAGKYSLKKLGEVVKYYNAFCN